MEVKHPEIFSSIFAGPNTKASVEVLGTLVLDLFMEVEALREALIRIEERKCGTQVGDDDKFKLNHQIVSWEKSLYHKAYVETAYETHNNGGPSGGLDKLLARFYPMVADEMGRTWRECLLLERLGFSQVEIAEYKKAAEDAEMFT
jgi:hypothetical protein